MINGTDIRLCNILLEYKDGATLTTTAAIDMEKCIIRQVRNTFQNKALIIKAATVKCPGVNFKWKELGL
jgi:hypothetical protein